MILRLYPRSSALWRLRTALSLEALAERPHSDPLWRNPQGPVPAPALEIEDERVLTQSLAVIDRLDETVSGKLPLCALRTLTARREAVTQAAQCKAGTT